MDMVGRNNTGVDDRIYALCRRSQINMLNDDAKQVAYLTPEATCKQHGTTHSHP